MDVARFDRAPDELALLERAQAVAAAHPRPEGRAFSREELLAIFRELAPTGYLGSILPAHAGVEQDPRKRIVALRMLRLKASPEQSPRLVYCEVARNGSGRYRSFHTRHWIGCKEAVPHAPCEERLDRAVVLMDRCIRVSSP